MTQKQEYREFCEQENDLPIFFNYWWLDIVSKEWDVAIVKKDKNIVGVMPYALEEKFIFNGINNPPLTYFLGPYIVYPKKQKQKYETRIGYEKKIMYELIDSLPNFDFFNQAFYYNINNWLPFYWKGFTQYTRYTYVLNNIKDLDNIWKNMNNRNRTDIRNASKKIIVKKENDINLSYKLISDTFKIKNKEVPYDFNLIKNLDDELRKRKKREIFIAYDLENNPIGTIYIVYDSNSAYYLMGGVNLKGKKLNANTLLLWESIKYFSDKVKKFDFLGSMIEPIEKHFRSFGGTLTPYFQINKINNKLWKIYSKLIKR